MLRSRCSRTAVVLAAGGLAAALVAVPPASQPEALAKDKDPAASQVALDALTAAIDVSATKPSAKAAKPGEDVSHVKTLRKAIDTVKPLLAADPTDRRLATAWNEGLTLATFHGQKHGYSYASEKVTFAGMLEMHTPIGREWQRRDSEMSQQLGAIHNTVARRPCRKVTIWTYNWNTVYSGVGGENAKGLAEVMLLDDRAGMSKVESRSQRVTMTTFNKAFPKAAYYEVSGTHEKDGRVRRRSYYVKGKSRTFCFDVVDYRATEAEDTPYVAWQFEGETPEIEVVIASADDAVAEAKK